MAEREVDVQPSITSEEFLRTGRDVRIATQPGFLCKVRMKALIDIPPEELFILLTSENNSSVFSSIERTIRRDIISENSSERVVYLEQAAVVGAWKFKRQFTTACFVTEYMKKLSADFSLAKPGIMASFQGHWSLTPVSPEAYERMSAARRPQEAWERDLISSRSNSASTMKTLMYLDQDVGPAAARKVPPMFRGILRRMCASAAIDVFKNRLTMHMARKRSFQLPSEQLYKDLTVVAALRQKGVSLETLLESRVHGRGGLKRGLLQKNRGHSDNSGTALESEDLDKPLPVFGDAASSVTSSPIRSFACDFADTALDDFGDDWAALENTGSASGSDMPSPRVLQCSTPARVTLVSFMLLDFDAFSEDDGVE